MKIWQLLAGISGSIITVVMALASTSYSATLATPEPAFHWLPVPNTLVFAVMALAFDLGMIASIFGALHWWPQNRIGAITCVALFVIASLFSIHAVRGYIATNVTKAAAPLERSADIYSSLKLELQQTQKHLGQLQSEYGAATRRDRRRLDAKIADVVHHAQELRTRLARTNIATRVSPLVGLEWFLAGILWFFNATCWSAWFGTRRPVYLSDVDTVAEWMGQHDLSEPQHCARVFETYERWCEGRDLTPLAQYSFYARLIELGATKFRDGRNGPTMYQMKPPGGPGSQSGHRHNSSCHGRL